MIEDNIIFEYVDSVMNRINPIISVLGIECETDVNNWIQIYTLNIPENIINNIQKELVNSNWEILDRDNYYYYIINDYLESDAIAYMRSKHLKELIK